MNKTILVLLTTLLLATSCKTTKDATSNLNELMLDEVEVVAIKHSYKGSATQKNDLIHTNLDVSFDWEKQHLFGKAILTLKPYFYATDKLELDAKGMKINEIALLTNGAKTPLKYKYDNRILSIALDKVYKRTDSYKIFIDYVSMPNELEKAEGLSAITDDKGLFFINPLGEEKDKPRQIWTQGEPESNSVWFPTIDHPNERCTQEIKITVENEFLAMSNGVLISDVGNSDGTHTVYWKQDKPHAPYLFMMAIGEFHETKDDWNGMSVNYYVEDEYANVAQEIFGKTPRMITFFAEQLGVDYAWDKYWQVCVRDYVSGAMENTSAVIFGEFVQRDERELLDQNFEDIVAHELYHHWFGDLVTCESWANLPLNESFATYGEVLWREHEFGEDARGRKIYEDMTAYFNEAAQGKQVDMIRYQHGTAEEMFDSHSYAKGSTILNMLREVVGDEAFFESLRVYLEDNKFQSVEIHNLRLAFEKVTGEDLNWFFNQWFLSAGHPIIDISYKNMEGKSVVTLKQEPSAETNLVYTLPMAIDIYDGNKYRREEVVFDQKEQSFEFETSGAPFLINVDADKSILAEITDKKSTSALVFQFMNAKNFMDRLLALEALAASNDNSEEVKDVFLFALRDPYWYIQKLAVDLYPLESNDTKGIDQLKKMATSATKSQVQSAALLKLSELNNSTLEPIFTEGLKHPSYLVNAAALEGMITIDADKALEQADAWKDVENYDVMDAVGYTFSAVGEKDKAPYFEDVVKNSKGFEKYYGVYYYSLFLKRMDKNTALDGMDFIENFGKTDEGGFSKNVAISALRRIQNEWTNKANSVTEEMNASGISKSQKLALENELVDYQFVIDRAQSGLDALNVAE